MSGQYKVAWLCEALLVSRSGYYDWKERRADPDRASGEHALAPTHPRGVCSQSPDLWQPAAGSGAGLPGTTQSHCPSHASERIFARQRSKYRVATTDSRHGGPIAPNRLQRSRRSNGPTKSGSPTPPAVLTGQGWLYLVAVLDVFTRRVVGWAMSQILDAPLVIAALRMALMPTSATRKTHHPLRSRRSVRQRRLSPTPRPTRLGRFHEPQRQLLRQCLHRVLLEHPQIRTGLPSSLRHLAPQARTAIFDYIETFYNRTRLHSSLDYHSPINFESKLNQNYPSLLSDKLRQAPTSLLSSQIINSKLDPLFPFLR